MMTTGEKLYTVELDSGDVVMVSRLSPFARIAILEKAAELYPLPDPTPFQKPIPNTPPGVTLLTPPEDDPQYKALVKAVQTKRDNYYYEALIVASVVDMVGGREAGIARYAEQLAAIRRRANVNELYTDWQATVLFCIVRVPADTTRIAAVAADAFQLEEAEIRAGIASFRAEMESSTYTRYSGQESTPGATTAVG